MSVYRLLLTREPAHAVAVIRIVYGIAFAAHFANLLRTGVWRWVWLPPDQGGLVPLVHGRLEALVAVTATSVQATIWVAMICAVLLALGVATPLANLGLVVTFAALHELGPNAGGSYDHLGGAVLWVLLFSGAGGAWSVDAWLRRRRGLAEADAPAGIRWLLVWQLVCMYDSTAWHKLSASWLPLGNMDALWYILQQPTWQRGNMEWLAPLYPLTRLGTFGTWCFEHLSPALLLAAWYRHSRLRAGWLRAQFNRVDWRLPYLFAGVVLHLGIEATMEVGAFTPLTLGLYAACFSGDEVRKKASDQLRERRGS